MPKSLNVTGLGWPLSWEIPTLASGVEALLKKKPQTPAEASINGHLTDRDGVHSIANYARNGVSWVAEIQDSDGAPMHSNAWPYFHAERLGYWRGHDPYGSLHALPVWMLEEIGRLHREREARQRSPADRRSKVSLAEAAAGLHFALHKLAAADRPSDRRNHSVPRRAAPAVGCLNSLILRMRSFLSRTTRTAG